MPDDPYESSGHEPVFADFDGTLHCRGGELDLRLHEDLFANELPTTDPGVAGKVYVDAGVLKVSAGA